MSSVNAAGTAAVSAAISSVIVFFPSLRSVLR